MVLNVQFFNINVYPSLLQIIGLEARLLLSREESFISSNDNVAFLVYLNVIGNSLARLSITT